MITVSFPANAFTFGNTVMITVSKDGFGQPELISVADSMYEVVLVGVTIGESEPGSFKPEDGNHVNEVPFVCPFNCAVELKQISASTPAFTVGRGITVTITSSVAIQPPILEVI